MGHTLCEHNFKQRGLSFIAAEPTVVKEAPVRTVIKCLVGRQAGFTRGGRLVRREGNIVVRFPVIKRSQPLEGIVLRSGPCAVQQTRILDEGLEGRTEAEVTNVVISAGSGVEGTVTLQQLSPQFQGALVVCSGGGEPTVQLRLVEAVSALTGLGADKISVCKGK